MFELASKLKLRVNTTVGPLSVEQLWELSLAVLDATAVALQEQYKKSGKKSFLVKKSKKDKMLKLALDIVLRILEVKVEERDALASAGEKKRHNDKINGLIALKKDEALMDMSAEELEKLLK